MTFEKFCKQLGIRLVADHKGWGVDNLAQLENLKIDGPYVDEWGNMIVSINIPDDLWKVLTDH